VVRLGGQKIVFEQKRQVPTESVIYLSFDQLDVACDFQAEQIVVVVVVVVAAVVVFASHSDSQ